MGTHSEKLARCGQLFEHYNARRLDYLMTNLTREKRDILDLIPVFLHEDSLALPGGTFAGAAPSGITGFVWTPRLRDLVSARFGGFVPACGARPVLPLLFLALMGSAGTIAFTGRSDMDFWVGVDSDRLDPDSLDLLSEKCRDIEYWALESAGFEIHFFVADPKLIRASNFGELAEESCGSAMGSLLKDEFYRTAIFLCGRRPLYWLVPAGTSDATYTCYAAASHLGSGDIPAEHVDLGNAGSIQAEEFFGAAVWQLLKSLNAPFKSVLKMALLDKYSAQGKAVPPLCEQLKRDVMDSAASSGIDPYRYMIEQVRSYYLDLNADAPRLLVEECFMVRNLLAQERPLAGDKARSEYFVQLGTRWGWSRDRVEALGNFRNWSAARREGLYGRIIRFLIDTYQRIRLRTAHVGAAISERDLTVAGRRLQVFFQQRNGKIPYELSLYRGPDIARIEFDQQRTSTGAMVWRVDLRLKGAADLPPQINRTTSNPFVACAWCAINRFFDGSQQIRVRCVDDITPGGLSGAMNAIGSFFAPGFAEMTPNSELLLPRQITHLFVMPNWNCPGESSALKSMLVFARTSWGEVAFRQRIGDLCEEWFFDEVIDRQVGGNNFASLNWTVHTTLGSVSSTRVVSDALSRQIELRLACPNNASRQSSASTTPPKR